MLFELSDWTLHAASLELGGVSAQHEERALVSHIDHFTEYTGFVQQIHELRPQRPFLGEAT